MQQKTKSDSTQMQKVTLDQAIKELYLALWDFSDHPIAQIRVLDPWGVNEFIPSLDLYNTFHRSRLFDGGCFLIFVHYLYFYFLVEDGVNWRENGIVWKQGKMKVFIYLSKE